MMENRDKILSRAEIAEKVWDTTFDTGTNFIDVYINYLRKKIDKDFPAYRQRGWTLLRFIGSRAVCDLIRASQVS